jgi:two-component system response regulator FlrC
MRHILIADDDRLLRESLGEALADLGWATHLVANGGEAIQILSDRSLDLVLSDVDMPDLTGFQLLAWMEGHPSRPPAILMSARASEALARSAVQAGALALLPKPVPLGRLTTLLNAC